MPSGGKREGSGRKKKFNVPTKKIVLERVIPTEVENHFIESVNSITDRYKGLTPEQLKSITNTSSPAKEIAEMVKGKTEGI